MNEATPQRTLSYARRAALGAGALLLAAGVGRLLIDHSNAGALQSLTAASLQRTVLVAHATAGKLMRTVALPTTVRGHAESSIYARGNGYLTAWQRDIGELVKKGDRLATIDAPEQDQELAQARATRLQLQSRLALARQTEERWLSLRRHDGASPQDLEEKRSAVLQAEADLDASSANVRRLEQLAAFRRIVAPFSGVITRRGVEVGDLIAPGGRELFAVAQTDPLRLTIWVPPAYAGDVKIGDEASVSLNERPGAPLRAAVERIAGGIDPQTRARQVDLILPNADARLLPGAYAEVLISLSSGLKTLVAPASALMVGADGFRVAVVGKDHCIAFRGVQVGRDLGQAVEVLAGISAEDLLVISPSDQLVAGETVRTLAWAPKPKS